MKKARLFVSLFVCLALLMTTFSFAEAQGPAGGWSSGIACQNLDDGAQAVVTLTFYAENSAAKAKEYSSFIDAGGSKNWLTTSASSMPGFPTNFTGSAVISSSTQLACNLNTQSTGTGTTSSPYRMGTAAGFNDEQTSSTMYVPQAIKNAANFNTYIAVQNTSNSSVEVELTYYNSNGSAAPGTETGVIPAQSTKIFYQSANANLPNGFNGGAVVEAVDPADAKLAVVVAMYKNASNYYNSQFQSYNGFPALTGGAGANKLYVPRFVRKLAGNNSGIAIQNVGTVATTITATFSFSGVQYPVTSPNPVGPGASWLLYAPSIAALAPVDAQVDHQGSAVITTSNSSARIVATVNEDNNDASSGNRRGHGATYNAILAGDESDAVFFAQFTKSAANVFSSGLQVSNTTGSAGTCDIEYIAQPGINENNVPLPANGSIVRWAPSNADPVMKSMTAGYNAAVKVTCTQPVTGIVNMSAYGSKYGDSFTQTTGLNQ